MKILIVSDTHRYDTNLEKVLEKENPLDCFIHLGDAAGSEDYIARLAECPVHMVRGNNDFFCDLPNEQEFLLGSYKVFITHGHYYYVGQHTEELRRQARVKGVDIVMFGHTHKPLLDEGADLIVLNPGSLSYPRQDGRKPSYILMELDEDGKAHFKVNFIEN